jgi:iron complex transport system ATP-binding protein
MSLIEVADIYFAYENNPVLAGISFNVEPGNILGIIGPNGSGKSTLLRILAGLLKTREGQVKINQRPISSCSPRELARMIAVVPEETLVTFPFTVEQLVMMGRAPHRSFMSSLTLADREAVDLAMVETGVKGLKDHFINELSSGERQRVFIAQALAQQPRIMLLDEPTAHLDINYQTEIFDLLLHQQAKNGLTIIVVSHDLNLASLYCEKLLLLRAGRIFAHGAPAEVITPKILQDVYRNRVQVSVNQATNKPQISLIPKGAV